MQLHFLQNYVRSAKESPTSSVKRHNEPHKITNTVMKQCKEVNGDLNITKTRLFKYMCIENFTSKNWKFSDKKIWYFSYFRLKHRLWVLEMHRIQSNASSASPLFYYVQVLGKTREWRSLLWMGSMHLKDRILFGFREYPKSIILSRNKKNNVYPCKPQFYYISGSKLYRRVFVMSQNTSKSQTGPRWARPHRLVIRHRLRTDPP